MSEMLWLKDLKEGDIIRHKSDGKAYIVTGNYGNHVTAVRTADITNASEWERLTQFDEEGKKIAPASYMWES